MVNNIANVASARETILNAYIVPSYESLLRDNAMKKSAHASTAIEGNPLDFTQVDKLIKGEYVAATEKAKKEVLNYYNVLENIEKYPDKGKITQNTILKMHNDITKDTLVRPECEGHFRDSLVAVVNVSDNTARYVPPSPDKVPKLIENFIKWVNVKDDDISPVLIAGISHYELVRIHPFIDGNGRTARALATLILYLKKFDIKRYFALDEYYDTDRKSYGDALTSADRTNDLTFWLEYFSTGVLFSISKVRDEVLKFSSERQRIESRGQISLSDKEIIIVNYLRENEKIANRNVQEIFEIGSSASGDILKKLIEKQVIEKKGAGPKTHYVLK